MENEQNGDKDKHSLTHIDAQIDNQRLYAGLLVPAKREHTRIGGDSHMQKGTPITELTVNSLQGDFYELFRKYVEKHGGTWTEKREADQLQRVRLLFPPGTISTQLPGNSNYNRYQITFADGAIMFWYYQQVTRTNSISIPYVYL
ncbi:MAG TPA: hypothetical protein VF458_18885 [Ktedonobacteraceae bacterium]